MRVRVEFTADHLSVRMEWGQHACYVAYRPYSITTNLYYLLPCRDVGRWSLEHSYGQKSGLEINTAGMPYQRHPYQCVDVGWFFFGLQEKEVEGTGPHASGRSASLIPCSSLEWGQYNMELELVYTQIFLDRRSQNSGQRIIFSKNNKTKTPQFICYIGRNLKPPNKPPTLAPSGFYLLRTHPLGTPTCPQLPVSLISMPSSQDLPFIIFINTPSGSL